MRFQYLMKYFFFLFLMQAIHAQKHITLRIDPDNAMGGTLSQYFEEVKYIPLETNDTCLFGDIYKLLITNDDGFLISDEDTKSFLSFDSTGHCRYLLNEHSVVNKEKLTWIIPSILAYNPMQDVVVTIAQKDRLRNIAFLDKNKHITGHSEYKDLPFSMTMLDSTYLLAYNYVPGDDSLVYLVNYYRNNDTVPMKQFIPVAKNTLNMVGGGFGRHYEFYNSGNHVLFSEGNRKLTFHIFDSAGLSQSYKLILPDAYSYPLDYDSLTGAKKQAAVNGRMKLVGGLRNIFEYKDWLFFETLSGSGYFFGNRHLMYNRKDGRLICLDRISSDSLSYFLPFHSEYGTITAIHGDYIYCYVPAYVMFDAKKEDSHLLWEKDPLLKHFFETGNRKSNPVIVRLKLKKNL